MAISDTDFDSRFPGMKLEDHLALARAPRLPPEKQWWNVPAKYAAAKRIKEEILRDYPGHDDAGDARRHAELSRRMASEIDPITALLAGVTHEIDNTMPPWFTQWPHADQNWHGQRWPERNMDLHNNAEGLRAAAERRPVNPRNLQTLPARTSKPLKPYGT